MRRGGREGGHGWAAQRPTRASSPLHTCSCSAPLPLAAERQRADSGSVNPQVTVRLRLAPTHIVTRLRAAATADSSVSLAAMARLATALALAATAAHAHVIPLNKTPLTLRGLEAGVAAERGVLGRIRREHGLGGHGVVPIGTLEDAQCVNAGVRSTTRPSAPPRARTPLDVALAALSPTCPLPHARFPQVLRPHLRRLAAPGALSAPVAPTRAARGEVPATHAAGVCRKGCTPKTGARAGGSSGCALGARSRARGARGWLHATGAQWRCDVCARARAVHAHEGCTTLGQRHATRATRLRSSFTPGRTTVPGRALTAPRRPSPWCTTLARPTCGSPPPAAPHPTACSRSASTRRCVRVDADRGVGAFCCALRRARANGARAPATRAWRPRAHGAHARMALTRARHPRALCVHAHGAHA